MSVLFFWLGIISIALTLLCLGGGVLGMAGNRASLSHHMMRGRIIFQWLAVALLLAAALTR